MTRAILSPVPLLLVSDCRCLEVPHKAMSRFEYLEREHLLTSKLAQFLVSDGLAAGDCFTQVGDRYTKPAPSTHRISAGITCPPSDNNVTCPLAVEGYIEEPATLNITTQSTSEVFDTVRTTDRPFEDSVRGSAPTFTFPIEPDRMGYYGFTVTLACFAGTLGDCIGGDVEPGTPIEACTPRTLSGGTTDGTPTLEGTGAFVQTDDISEMSTNPSATTMPAAGETTEMPATGETAESSATPKILRNETLFCIMLLALLGLIV
ncbi:MAG: hypothetical protein Q9193_002447 [Seirophora villosa]